MPRTNQIDPTRTTTLRQKFERKVRARFNLLAKRIDQLLIEDDVFGLIPRSPLIGNASDLWSVQLNILNQETQDTIHKMREQLKKEDVLELETQPHVTIRFGFKENIQNKLKKILDSEGVIDFRFGRLTTFKKEDQDVLYLEIKSKRLEEIHHQLGIFSNEQTHHTYIPHLTIAYLKSGTGDKYKTLYNPLFGLPYFQEYEIVLSSPQRVQTALVSNAREWEFLSDEAKLKEFEDWLKNETGLTIVSEEDRFWEELAQEGYERGAGRAFTDANKKRKGFERTQSKRSFMSFALGAPETKEKIKILASRVFTDIKGVAEVLATRIRKELVDGLIQGDNPRTVARRMREHIGKGQKHAERIARTEMIRAHAEGQLDSLERMGVEEVGVAVEWSTAGDTRVCPLCGPMEGVVLKVKESHGLIPRHPNCRCAWVPANVGESTTGQVRSKKGIAERIKHSIGKESKSVWVGKSRKIDKTRPKSILGSTKHKDPRSQPTVKKKSKPKKTVSKASDDLAKLSLKAPKITAPKDQIVGTPEFKSRMKKERVAVTKQEREKKKEVRQRKVQIKKDKILSKPVKQDKKAKELVSTPKLDLKSRAAAQDYTTDAFQRVNEGLRKGKITDKRIVEGTDKYLKSSPKYEGRTLRSFNMTDKELSQLKKELESGTLTDKAFVSTRKVPTLTDRITMETGNSAKGRVLFVLDGKSGVDISDISLNPGEGEVLYPRNTQFKVTKFVETEGGGIIATLTQK